MTLNTPLTIDRCRRLAVLGRRAGIDDAAAAASTTAVVTFAPTGPGVKNAVLTVTSSGGGSATVTLSGTGASPILISEIRFRGPAGGNDEFVEIYNNSDAAIDISGWKLHGIEQYRADRRARHGGSQRDAAGARALLVREHRRPAATRARCPGNKTYTTGFGDNGGVALDAARQHDRRSGRHYDHHTAIAKARRSPLS